VDAQDFLTRVVAPGAYYAFAFKRPGSSGLRHKFFPQADIEEAVRWLRHTADTSDVYHAVASFKEERRLQANVEALRCFWYDADISRPGDGKQPGQVWQTHAELIEWLWSVRDRLPMPNLWMSSGYGMHLYWVIDRALPGNEWTVHAKAFRSLLAELGARGDIGISTDSARILRPPETFNYKVPTDRVPCWEMTAGQRKLNLPRFYPADEFLAKFTTVVSSLGAPPPGKQPRSKLLAAAKANLTRPPPADFNVISNHCPQVKKSLAEGGEHDDRTLWHLMVNLAYFCNDREAAHRLGRKFPKYSEEETDAKFDQTEREHEEKGTFGAPDCASFDANRKGVCDNCAWRGKIKGPYNISTYELPRGYRQAPDAVERWDNELKDWLVLVKGRVDNAQLLDQGDGGGYRLLFDYTLDRTRHIQVDGNKVSNTFDKIRSVFAAQHLVLNRSNALKFMDFIMAWITELQEACKAVEAPPSFGWVRNKDTGELEGLSIGGTFYRPDGSAGVAQLGDPTIHKNYRPCGDIEGWREATTFVVGDKPELQVLVAASFAAPLMEFVGESCILSVWSSKSGARKTSAFRVGTAVWCNPITGMSAIRDTPNSVQHSLGETKFMPVYWDEIHVVNKDHIAMMVEMFFNITQGRGRARLDSKIEQRSVGYWRTLMAISANKPSAEIIEQDRTHTNAGALRLFEYQVEPAGETDEHASSTVQQVERNYGHAGREFAHWAASHVDDIQSTIKHIRSRLYRDVPDIRPEERFHVAVIVGVTAGAAIATQLKLIELDVAGIYKFLKEKFYEQRGSRRDENPVDDVDILSTKFERFMADHVDALLVTQSFAAPGRPRMGSIGGRIVVIGEGPNRNKYPRALIHIGLDEHELRFDHGAFKAWCKRTGESYTTILNLMKSKWGIDDKVRAILAISTEWSSGSKVPYYKLQLNRPELEHHLNWGTPAHVAATNVVPLRPPAE